MRFLKGLDLCGNHSTFGRFNSLLWLFRSCKINVSKWPKSIHIISNPMFHIKMIRSNIGQSIPFDVARNSPCPPCFPTFQPPTSDLPPDLCWPRPPHFLHQSPRRNAPLLHKVAPVPGRTKPRCEPIWCWKIYFWFILFGNDCYILILCIFRWDPKEF